MINVCLYCAEYVKDSKCEQKSNCILKRLEIENKTLKIKNIELKAENKTLKNINNRLEFEKSYLFNPISIKDKCEMEYW